VAQAGEDQLLAFVRRGYELWNQGDLSAVSQMWSDDFEWHNDPSWPGQTVYFGRDNVVRFLQEEVAGVIHLDDIEVESIEPVGDELVIRLMARTLGEDSHVDIEVERIERVGDELVICMLAHTRGFESAVDIGKVPVFHVARVANGRVVRVRAFLDEAQAFEAARGG
jgi:ketosteroid isomerase-like protein